jgi:hypothetical protein
MLGWHISVYRQTEGSSPATARTPYGKRLAVWQTSLDGLDWLDDLVKAGKAIDLGGDGYPRRYTATAENLLPKITDTPPGARTIWQRGANDFVSDWWEGKTVIDQTEVPRLSSGEWLLVVAWDES